MITDFDTYRAANLVTNRYGDNALIGAAQVIDRMLANGDEDGWLVWRRIKNAIVGLQAPSGRFTSSSLDCAARAT